MPPHLHPSREVPEFPHGKVLGLTVWLQAVWGGCFESQFYLRPRECALCTQECDRPSGQRPLRCVVQLLSCVWLVCDPVDCSLPGSSDHGIYQARIQEWVATSFSWRSNTSLLHWQVDSLPLCHLRSPVQGTRMMERKREKETMLKTKGWWSSDLFSFLISRDDFFIKLF